LCWVDLRVQR